MRFPLILRAWHDVAVARLTAERDQLAKDLAASEKELAGVSEKYTDTALHDQCALILPLPTRCPHREQLKQRLVDEPVLRSAFGAIADGIDYDADLAAFAGELLDEIHGDDHTTNHPTGD